VRSAEERYFSPAKSRAFFPFPKNHRFTVIALVITSLTSGDKRLTSATWRRAASICFE
jgi:hypothetical protein